MALKISLSTFWSRRTFILSRPVLQIRVPFRTSNADSESCVDAVCRGMKFENVSLLTDTLGETLDAFGETVGVGGIVRQRQSGVLRTNCMDCLDRTNVVQSACGQRALEKQLQKEGVTVDLRKDVTTAWFNTLWADNGDSISRQYANSAALKGDYTRTSTLSFLPHHFPFHHVSGAGDLSRLPRHVF